MIITQNKTPAKPTLKDLLDLFKKDIFTNLNCHAIGTIQKFDPLTQTVQVSINYKKTFFSSETDPPTLVDYPVLVDVPVVIMSGGNANLTFPIQTGDQCLILFNDRDIDNWHATGAPGPLNSLRMHSMADGIAIVGLKSTLNPIVPYDSVRAVLSNGLGGTTMVGVGPVLIKIGNVTGTLGLTLQTLIGALTALDTSLTAFASTLAAIPPSTTVTGAIIKPPSLALGTAVAAVQATITTVGTELAGILE